MGNMREISIEECMRVSGGEIVVSSSKPKPGSTGYTGTYGPVYNNSVIPAGIMSNPEVAYNPDTEAVDEGDDDGDGILNRDEEIVVTAGVTHGQIQFLNQAAAWYQWAQNVAFGLVAGGGLMTSNLTNGGQFVAGAAIGGAANVPPLSDAQYQANWNILYRQMQVDNLRGDTPNFFNPGLNMY